MFEDVLPPPSPNDSSCYVNFELNNQVLLLRKVIITESVLLHYRSGNNFIRSSKVFGQTLVS